MRKKNLTATIVTVLSVALLFLPILVAETQAKDKIGWIGPIYKSLSASLTKGFKAYCMETYPTFNTMAAPVSPAAQPVNNI
jgi:hypothetical protein|tara:strand:+ start:1523 stop:1765 length:243 start_codon:yes stop_codon:yes gene_type:complete